jgi:predicted phage terminase large subunit-like protein
VQRPAPAGGGIFKRDWIKLYAAKKPLPKFEYVIQSYDTAFTADTVNDATAFTAWGVFSLGEDKGYGAMLCDAWQDRIEFPDLQRRVMKEYRTRYGEGEGKTPDIILIESKGSGISLIQVLQSLNLPVRSYNPGRSDKVQRAHTVTHLLEAGLIYFPESDKFPGKPYSWAEEIIDQLLTFPRAEHDDYVDSMVQALQLLRDQTFLKVKGIEQPDEEERMPATNPYMA